MKCDSFISTFAVLWGGFEVILFAGVIFGWHNVVYIYKDLGYFSHLCPANRNETLSNSSGYSPHFTERTPSPRVSEWTSTPSVNVWNNSPTLDVWNNSATLDVWTNSSSDQLAHLTCAERFEVVALESQSDCAEQDEQFSLIYTLATLSTGLLCFINGYFYDRFGTRYLRIFSMFITLAGLLFLVFVTKETAYLLYPGFILISFGGYYVLITNFQLSGLKPRYRSMIIASYCGSFDTSATMFLFMKLAYENYGISPNTSFTLMTVVFCVFVSFSTFCLLPKYKIPYPPPSKYIFTPRLHRMLVRGREEDNAGNEGRIIYTKTEIVVGDVTTESRQPTEDSGLDSHEATKEFGSNSHEAIKDLSSDTYEKIKDIGLDSHEAIKDLSSDSQQPINNKLCLNNSETFIENKLLNTLIQPVPNSSEMDAELETDALMTSNNLKNEATIKLTDRNGSDVIITNYSDIENDAITGSDLKNNTRSVNDVSKLEHDNRPFAKIACSPLLLFDLLWLSFHRLRSWMFIGVFNPWISRLACGDKSVVSHYTSFLSSTMFVGVFTAAFSGCLMDRKITKNYNNIRKFERIHAAIASFVLNSSVGLVLSILMTIPVLKLQYLTCILFTLHRSFLYGPNNAFLANAFPVEHFGKLIGLTLSLSAIFGMIQHPLFLLIQGPLENNPLIVNVIVCTLILITYIHPLHIWYYLRRKFPHNVVIATSGHSS